MSGKTAAIIGVTGMIGQYLLEQILQDDYFTTVRLLVRRPMQKTHPKVEVKLVDYNDAESVKLALEEVDIIFSCIGTTQKQVKGDKKLYREIDYDIPLRVARFGKDAGASHFILVSSVGANPNAGNFYLKLKGELETAIEQVGISSVHLMQPSMLLGTRKDKRTGEKIIQGIWPAVSGLLFGSWRKYRGIHGRQVAKAMLAAARRNDNGIYRYTYDQLIALAEK